MNKIKYLIVLVFAIFAQYGVASLHEETDLFIDGKMVQVRTEIGPYFQYSVWLFFSILIIGFTICFFYDKKFSSSVGYSRNK